jgi:hypothetical protein
MTTVLLLSFALVLAAPALAEECTPSSSSPEFTTATCAVDGAPCYYVDNDTCGGGGMCIFSIWVYEESNGIPGLQRGDEVVDNTCNNAIAADTIVL